jgi:hypothetical protein
MKDLSIFIICFILSFNAYAQTTIDSVRVNDSMDLQRLRS